MASPAIRFAPRNAAPDYRPEQALRRRACSARSRFRLARLRVDRLQRRRQQRLLLHAPRQEPARPVRSSPERNTGSQAQLSRRRSPTRLLPGSPEHRLRHIRRLQRRQHGRRPIQPDPPHGPPTQHQPNVTATSRHVPKVASDVARERQSPYWRAGGQNQFRRATNDSTCLGIGNHWTTNNDFVMARLGCGRWGVIYGLKAKSFTAHGHFTTREPQSFAPTWGYRVFVVTISAVAAITSLLFLLRN